MPTPARTVGVLVLGDVGRSPRMQYHALSLATCFPTTRVLLIGYRGERCIPDVERRPQQIVPLLMRAEVLPAGARRVLPYAVYALLKAALGLLQLVWTLLFLAPRADVLLMQTPPAIPTLAAAWLVRAVRGTTLVVDWHNLAFSVMVQNAGLRAAHPLVRAARAYERTFAAAADAHLCVTGAMAAWLRERWGVDAHVLHDRPPAFFRRLAERERHELLLRIRPQLDVGLHGAPLGGADGHGYWGDDLTPWTRGEGGAVCRREGAPAIIVSSTSWTPDEDFSLLVDALVALDTALERQRDLAGPSATPRRARVVALVTGKGPLKASYECRFAELGLRHVAIGTLWLEPSDYPGLLGSADVGVSLHTSTSGLDLPMKVLDMFGCGLPVCARAFACLPELVTHGANGLVFSSAAELAEQLLSLLAPSDAAAAALRELRDGVAAAEAERPRWDQNWRAIAAPLFASVSAEQLPS